MDTPGRLTREEIFAAIQTALRDAKSGTGAFYNGRATRVYLHAFTWILEELRNEENL